MRLKEAFDRLTTSGNGGRPDRRAHRPGSAGPVESHRVSRCDVGDPREGSVVIHLVHGPVGQDVVVAVGRRDVADESASAAGTATAITSATSVATTACFFMGSISFGGLRPPLSGGRCPRCIGNRQHPHDPRTREMPIPDQGGSWIGRRLRACLGGRCGCGASIPPFEGGSSRDKWLSCAHVSWRPGVQGTRLNGATGAGAEAPGRLPDGIRDTARAPARTRGDARARLRASAARPLRLEGFDEYTALFGQLAARTLLVKLASRLAETLAPGGRAFRPRQDEFAALSRRRSPARAR